MRKRLRKQTEASPPARRDPANTGEIRGAWSTSWWLSTGKMTPFIEGISSPIMKSLSTGEEISSRDLPVGALFELQPGTGAFPTWAVGADGLAIACMLPDRHLWYMDSRASNCTMKDDTKHKCWVRHGTVGDLLTVDKAGLTCRAGAGSIKTDRFHGFLTKGRLANTRGA